MDMFLCQITSILPVYVQEESKELNHVTGEAKRFLAYEIVTRLKIILENELLKKLPAAVQRKERMKGKSARNFNNPLMPGK